MVKKIRNINQWIRNIIIFISAIFPIIVSGEKTIINILMKQPNMPDTLYNKDWEFNYENMINKYLKENNANDVELQNVEIRFIFNEYYIDDFEYYYYTKSIMENWKKGDFDLMIFDDRFLLCEIAFMESDWPLYELDERFPTLNLLENLFDYIEEEDLSYHDSKILKDAMYEDKLYGLPYEIDFNVLYYKNENEKAKEIAKDIEHITWKKIWYQLKPSEPLEIALGDEDSLLDFFIEYTNNYYNTTKEYDKEFYKVFYNETSENLVTSFRDFLIDFTGSNSTNLNVIPRVNETYYINWFLNNTLWLSYDQAYSSFIYENSSAFFRGRASHYPIFQYEPNISISLPPKGVSTLTERYLVVNKKSNKDKNLLTKIALQLTSKDIQLYRAKHFGSVPTFNITKKNEDLIINSYCQFLPEICNLIENVKRLYLRDVFKSKLSVPFYEVRVKLAYIMKIRLLSNVRMFVETTIFHLKNIYELITYDLGSQVILAYFISGVMTILLIFVIYLVYIQEDQPYLRVISPKFCILIIVGCILNLTKALECLPPYSIFKIKLFSVLYNIGIGLIYIPMIVVTYRIYSIYKWNSLNSEYLSNNVLYIGVFVIILILSIYSIIMSLFSEIFYMPYGDISTSRFPSYESQENIYYQNCINIFFHIIVVLFFYYINKYIFIK